MTIDNLKKHDERTGYYPWFDWLRAAAATTVMLAHGGVLSKWDNAGGFAVEVFFALSGFLIGGILLDLRPSDLPRFFFNRAIRIWVPYYLAVGILLAVSVLREPITPKWIEFVIYKLTFVYNLFGTQQLALYHDAMPQKGTLNHVWSVNAEEQFYLVAPWLLVLAAHRGGRAIVSWVVVAMAVAVLTPYYIAIVLGVLSAVVVRRFGAVHETPLGRGLLIVALLLSVWGLMSPLDYFLVAPVTGICIVLLLAVKGRRTGTAVIAGGMSYPLYLNHWIGFYAAHWLMKTAPPWIAVTFSSAVSMAIAVGLYWFVDRQLLRRRGDWFTPPRGIAFTGLAYSMIVAGVAYGWSMTGRL